MVLIYKKEDGKDIRGVAEMDNLEPKKLALIRIWEVLHKHSDYRHPMTQNEIGKKLEEDYGIIIERKAIGRNISLLKEAGVEIITEKNGSYIDVRKFEDAELHMLIDGVLSSKYITAAHSKDLIERLCQLSNKYFKASVKHIYSVNDWSKTDNQQLFRNIEIVSDAIERGKQIEYDYNKYGIDKKLEKSRTHIISPYQMILHNQRYYLMGRSERWGDMAFHRLDHITDMKIIGEKATPITEVKGYEKGINYKELSSSMPYMYSDKPEWIEFLVDEEVIDQIVEWFGKDVDIKKKPDDSKVKVKVKVSPNAMEHWAMQYINHVEIVLPESMRMRIKDILEKAMEKYEQ